MPQFYFCKVTNTGENDNISTELDDFTRRLTADDARVLIDLLKLAVASRAGIDGRKSLSHVLTALGKSYAQVRFLAPATEWSGSYIW